MDFVREYKDAKNAISAVRSSKPDLILKGIEMPGISGIEAVSIIKLAITEVSILKQTIFDDETMIFDALKAGASGSSFEGRSERKI
jgi:DNA-binding NarL/FixJ family response regulator